VFSVKKSTAYNGLMCSCVGASTASCLYWSRGTSPKNQSARPDRTAETAARALDTKRQSMLPGLPAGWAACDHSWKYRLRSSRIAVAEADASR
jgi:hypothetical protein